MASMLGEWNTIIKIQPHKNLHSLLVYVKPKYLQLYFLICHHVARIF
jgi:hypothetical protein